jgi:polyvinyl alcohol dehydrogenase (cytochrome)
MARLRLRLEQRLLVILTAACASIIILIPNEASAQASWLVAGQNAGNTRNQPAETKISPATARNLTTKWIFNAGGSVLPTPTTEPGAVYVPDNGGHIFKVDAATGNEIWSQKIGDLVGVGGLVSRSSPAIVGDRLIVGTWSDRYNPVPSAWIVALDKQTGKLLWKTSLTVKNISDPARTEDPSQFGARVFQSPVPSADLSKVFVGISGLGDEAHAADDGFACCTFKGAMFGLDTATGKILWKTPTLPPDPGYAGVGVWGHAPVVDSKRGLIYVGTGNDFKLPDGVMACIRSAVALGSTPQSAGMSCDPKFAQNHFDSILALRQDTGAIAWDIHTNGFDAWNTACTQDPPGKNCPSPHGPDEDFGMAPQLFRLVVNGVQQDVLGIGRKAGEYRALLLSPDPALPPQNFWGPVRVGPGTGGGNVTGLGGMERECAVDGVRIYCAIINDIHQPVTLVNGQTTTGGFWTALDAGTGAILWQTANPTGATALGPVSVANGVVYVSSFDDNGFVFALNASNGAVLSSLTTDGSVGSGAAIADGVVFWGSGYGLFSRGGPPAGSGNNKLFAFTVR